MLPRMMLSICCRAMMLRLCRYGYADAAIRLRRCRHCRAALMPRHTPRHAVDVAADAAMMLMPSLRRPMP